jgi:DNA-binding CsgD family transcriptional regulator
MQILEREDQLAQLTGCFDRVLRGHGVCALVYGEAGVGKTSLVNRFLHALPAAVERLVSGCEDLFAPRPLGPLVDLAGALPPGLSQALREGRTYNGLFPELLAYLKRARSPRVLAIEDLHWADESTLDCVRYVARRLADVPVHFIVTYRDDGLRSDHPLRRLLGDLPSATTVRVPVACLSQAAVTALARSAGRDGAGLYEATGGNPFFVTEVLASLAGAVPASVRDAVLTRLSRLSVHARDVCELASVCPGSIERTLVERLVDNASALVDECIDMGMLHASGSILAFRHELAREAVEQALPAGRAAQWHRRVFRALRESASGQRDLPRIVHHAERAGLDSEVALLAPIAARAAADLSAHREAASLYALAVRSSTATHQASRAALLEAAAQELRLTGAAIPALDATREALSLRLSTGDALHAGMNYRIMAAAQWRELADRTGAKASIEEAIRTLETIKPSPELARAYAELARLRSSWSEFESSISIGERALSVAESLGEPHALVDALHVLAAAMMFVRDDRAARAQLERALDIALAQRMDDAAGHLYSTLQVVSVIHHDHAYALAVGERGIEYCEARDLDLHRYWLVHGRAVSLIELGRWPEADRTIAHCMAAPLPDRVRNSLLFLEARLKSRRGVASADAYWRKLQDDPGALPTRHRMPAVAAACAEAAWLRGDVAAAVRVAELGLRDALARNDTRLLGPLLVWHKRLDVPVPPFDQTIAPACASELAGDIGGAAAHWASLACVYERALALLHGDAAELREALDVLEPLGAVAAAEIARARLRSRGVRGVRRGPLRRTRADPLGLTARERTVYELVVEGLSNAAIAQRLHRSERTVEHHVASLLAKLKARSRVELVANVAAASPAAKRPASYTR